MPQLETFGKRAAIASLLLITGLQLAVHPDMTWTLQAAGAAAVCLGWVAAGSRSHGVHVAWLVLAALSPALMLLAAGRQGPIVDVVWMAGLTASLLRTMSWSRWSLPPLWSVLLGGWALALALVWPVLVLREAGFDLDALRDMTAINSWAMLPAPQVVAWTLYVVQVQLLGLFWFEWVHGVFTSAPDRLPRVAHGLWIGITLGSVVALVQGTVDLAFMNADYWTAEGRATGTMLDANAYGVAAALAGPVGFLAMRGSHLWAAVLVIAVNWAGVWMSGSRTGLLCALFGAGGLAVGLWRSRQDRPAPRHALRLLAVAGAMTIVVGMSGAIGPLQRKEGLPANIQELASLWDRGGYGTIATEMVREYPLTGVGAGAYRYLAADYYRAIADDMLALDNAQNWWRHQLAELGLLGGGLVLLWSVVVAWQTIAAGARPRQQLPAWSVRGLLVGLGVASIVGIPTQNPVMLLWFFFLIAWLSVVVADVPAMTTPPTRRLSAGWTIAVVLAVAYAGGHLLLANGPLDVTTRAKRFRRDFVAGAHAPETLPDGRVFWWTDDESRFVLRARSRWLVMHLWAHHPDVEQRPVTVSVSGPCGVLFEHELKGTTPFAVGLLIPDGVEMVDTSVAVSRTWTPADQGLEDSRQLGVGVMTEFIGSDELAELDYSRAAWTDCPAR